MRSDIPRPDRDARILLLGTGSAMVEQALDLISHGHRGKLVALSRRGTLPPRLDPESAARLHEIIAWHRLELRAGHLLSSRVLRKGSKVRAIRIAYYSRELQSPAKLEVDSVLDCRERGVLLPALEELYTIGAAGRLSPRRRA
jgi:uncharacterized NAD(P)/FAD-binding protein YdhS